jgi:acetolactate synthase I/III small subunit
MRHTISVLVENKFGVLTRIAGLFSGRGYNIDTLNVAPTHDPSASRMTIVTRGDDATLEQVVKQLNKLPDVLKVQDFRDGEYVDRELLLVKVAVDSHSRAEVMQITDIFRAKIVDVQPKSVTVEITGSESKVEAYLELMKGFEITDLTRTGQVAMPRR